MYRKINVKMLIGLLSIGISSNALSSTNYLIHFPPTQLTSFDDKKPSSDINNKTCNKDNIIYFNRTAINKKIVELCHWGEGLYRYKYGKLDNPEIVLYSRNVTKEDAPNGGFSFVYGTHEYSIMEDGIKPALYVYVGEEVLTQIYLNKKSPGYINKTLTDLPEKVY